MKLIESDKVAYQRVFDTVLNFVKSDNDNKKGDRKE